MTRTLFSWFWTAQGLRSFSEENIVCILENVVKIMHKRFKKLKRRSRRLRNRFGLYEILRTLLSKMGLETPFERKFKDYLPYYPPSNKTRTLIMSAVEGLVKK